MNKVYVVMGWMLGEESFISGIFKSELEASVYASKMEYEDEYNYQYIVQAWEVR